MKKLIFLTLLISLRSLAQSPSSYAIPRLSVTANALNIEILNANKFDLNCSGMVYLHTTHGQTDTQYFSSRVFALTTFNRTLWPTNMSDSITYFNHTISCYQAK